MSTSCSGAQELVEMQRCYNSLEEAAPLHLNQCLNSTTGIRLHHKNQTRLTLNQSSLQNTIDKPVNSTTRIRQGSHSTIKLTEHHRQTSELHYRNQTRLTLNQSSSRNTIDKPVNSTTGIRQGSHSTSQAHGTP